MADHRVVTALRAWGFTMIALGFAGNLAAQAPAATTGAASAIGSSEATLNGTVNANGAATTVSFEYGLTTAYGGSIAAVQSPLSGSTDTAVSATLGELAPSTSYHYRVVAQSVNGTTYGADMSFTTLPAAPAVATTAATGVGADGATLNGLVNPYGDSTSVVFEYGLDTSYGSTVTAVQSPLDGAVALPVSAVIGGLAIDTTYHFRVVAANAGGTSYGADLSFTTSVGGVPPTAVTGVATAVSATGATVNGTVNAGGAATVVSFEYGIDASYGAAVPADQSPLSGSGDEPVSAALGELAPSTSYHYRVVAQSVNGTSYGADLVLTTLPLAPAAVTGTALADGATAATLGGTVNANGAATAVTFEYGPDTGYGSTVVADQSPVDGTADTTVSRTVTGLSTGAAYHFRVVAASAGGTTYGGDESFVAGAPPPAASTGPATEVGTSSATLNGTVNANGQDTTVGFEYGLDTDYGRSVSAIPGSVSGSAAVEVAAALGDLLPATTYHFRVVASSGGGVSTGADRSFTTLAAPSVATRDADPVAVGGATLNGTVNANGSSTVASFEYGPTTAYGTTVTAVENPVDGSADTAVSAALSGLAPDTTYHFRAVGMNVHGTTYGADRSFFTSAPAAPAVSTEDASLVVREGALLNGTVAANNAATTVSFEYGPTAAYGSSVAAQPGLLNGTAPTAVSAELSGLVEGTTYHFRAVGVNANGTIYGADRSFSTTANDAPAALTGEAAGITSSAATLGGTVNPNTDSATVTVLFQYGLTSMYTNQVTGAPSPLSGRSNIEVEGALTGLAAGTTYHYRVVAQSPFGFAFGGDRSFTTAALEPPPAATTTAATGVGASSALLNGTVNANGTTAAVVFEYGLDTSYGKVAAADQSPVTGSTDTAVSRSVDELMPSTTYHYRVVAQNADHTVSGADQTLSTLGVPPAATTDGATAISDTGATLNGTVSANNETTTVRFEYGLDTSYGSTATADQSPVSGIASTPVSASLSGLGANLSYHYRVVAENSSGTTFGADRSFTTGGAAPLVSTGAASAVTASTATLNGSVNANGNSTVVTFEYGETTAYGRVETAAQSPLSGFGDTAVSAAVIGLSPGTVYHFRVVGESGAGSSAGADMTFTTGAPPPSALTGEASTLGTTEATLNGTVNANGNLTTVSFEYGLDTGYGSTVSAEQSPVSGTADTAVSAMVSGLEPVTTYHFRVVAENGVGTSYGEDMVLTTVPLAPLALTGTAIAEGATAATLRGTVNANGAETTVRFEYGLDTGYGSTVSAEQSPVSGAADTAVSALVSGLEPATTYHFRVVAESTGGTTYGDDAVLRLNEAAAIPASGTTGLAVMIGLLLLSGVIALRRMG
jgi:phosphodiesterase/alkaline phosphatase D-like protein